MIHHAIKSTNPQIRPNIMFVSPGISNDPDLLDIAANETVVSLHVAPFDDATGYKQVAPSPLTAADSALELALGLGGR